MCRDYTAKPAMRDYQEVRPTFCMYTMMARDKLKKKLWWPTVAGGLVEKICLLVRPLQAAFWSKSKRLLFDRPMFADPFRCFMTLGHGEILRKKIHVHFV